MNRDPLTRAVLAACLTAALLAPGLLLSHSALSSPVAQNQHPDKYLPLILGRGLLPEELTATAMAATLTAIASTRTATATSTATPTTTATATPSPTSDALATAQLQIANHTGFALTFTLAGPTNASAEVQPNQSWLVWIRPGHYILTAETQCSQPVPVEFDVAAGQSIQQTYNCP